ncbi:Ran GTPase-activating protein (RanGAP) involved in mRNA processing and transport [Legionella massiliensis]|uniref:Ran GTPase-activating protein (RanGAP) involved in mRNA processing and transport n=1 Tax=Legionella massiliensis TaxID=1034943 RepID=A0A078KWG0_9GAMM|nr:hypothetical protein [Legionella massiliensis]CDZ77337.1 Ran GTPase-activating protein (RanGAP) involved in mRNA processing and transport [Legionella massiliensis]CEE13075.1 Leucine Rich Repeat protein [Legionella massiliensis]
MQYKLTDGQNKTVAVLVKEIQQIPVYMSSLELDLNQLGARPIEELVQILGAIRDNLTELNLYNNSLSKKTGAELAEAFNAIHDKVTRLNLGFNELGTKTGEELDQAFIAIRANVISLDLNSNGLGKKTGEELANMIRHLPRTITHLDLSNNHLTEQHLWAMLPALRLSNIKTLDLGDTRKYSLKLKTELIGPPLLSQLLENLGHFSQSPQEQNPPLVDVIPLVPTM